MSDRGAPSAVAVTRVEGPYPSTAPFHPDQHYPEYGARPRSEMPNPVYRAVRHALHRLGYDRQNFGRPEWNPLGAIIRPGDRVFIKPNLVAHEFRGARGELFSVITHPSVVRAVADYAAIALAGKGEIVIGDNPSIDADFDRILQETSLDSLPLFYRQSFGLPCRVLDLRPARTGDLADYGYRSRTLRQSGDPEGSSVLNLGDRSYFYGLNPLLFRGVFTNRWETIAHHHGKVQEYSIANTILRSDVYISIPKLKAHHKVGTTLNVKGLVGISSNKNYLIHWRIGFPATGGDEYPRAYRRRDHLLLAARHLATDVLPERLHRWLRQNLRENKGKKRLEPQRKHRHEHYRGAWDGNDTTWRMAADLYQVFVADEAGFRRQQGRTMQFFSVVDGVIGGEGDGPFSPIARPGGVLVAGEDLLIVDCVASRLMDYDLDQIRYLRHLVHDRRVDLDAVQVALDSGDVVGPSFFHPARRYLGFAPPSGWPALAIHGARAA